MRINNNIFAAQVAVSGGIYEHVSENFAKHLPYQHPFSTKRHPVDQADGMLSSGCLVCNDGMFIANERIASYIAKNGGSADYPGNGETIAMCEWPTQGRIRDLRYFATTTENDPDSYNTGYFAADTDAAFPSFTLVALDPADPDFRLPLIDTKTETDSASATFARPKLSLQALTFGVNRRKNPLIIAAELAGSVVANSGLWVFAEFVVPDC